MIEGTHGCGFGERKLPEKDANRMPVASDNAIAGHEGETLISLAVTRAGHHYRPNSGLDFGVDGRIEILRVTGERKVATGREIAVQSKRGEAAAPRTRYGYTLYFSEAHANYWIGHSLPVIVAHSVADETVRWAPVTSETVRKTEHGYAIDLPGDSDLSSAGPELAALADPSAEAPARSQTKSLLIRVSIHGDLIDDRAEVGLAALETSRRLIRGERAAIEVELEGTDVLLAEVDALADMEAPDIEARRRRIRFEDALATYRSKARFLTRAVSLLLGSKDLMAFFGDDDCALAGALTALLRDAGPKGDGLAALQTWPAPRQQALVIGFDVQRSDLDAMRAREPGLTDTIKLADATGFLVRDLPRSAVQSGLLPCLARRFVNYADSVGMEDHEVLASSGVDLENWMVGLG